MQRFLKNPSFRVDVKLQISSLTYKINAYNMSGVRSYAVIVHLYEIVEYQMLGRELSLLTLRSIMKLVRAIRLGLDIVQMQYKGFIASVVKHLFMAVIIVCSRQFDTVFPDQIYCFDCTFTSSVYILSLCIHVLHLWSNSN